MDAPHAQVSELLARALGVMADDGDIAQFGGDVVCWHHAVGKRGGRNFRLGADDERVFELPRAFHRAARDRAMMSRDEIHQTEVERLHALDRGDIPHLAQGAMGLDQDVHRQGPRQGAVGLDAAQFADLGVHILRRAHLGQGDEGQALACAAHQNLEVFDPVRMSDVVDAHTHAAKVVVCAIHQLRHHVRMLGLRPSACAIFAVAGEVEDRAQFLLQLQGLEHQLVGTGIVINRGQRRKGLLASEQDGVRVQAHAGSPWGGRNKKGHGF